MHTVKQHLRYAYRAVTFNPMCGRQVGFTVCGQLLRLWLFDAGGYTCTRAVNVTDPGPPNAIELAQILLFSCSFSQGPRAWSRSAGRPPRTMSCSPRFRHPTHRLHRREPPLPRLPTHRLHRRHPPLCFTAKLELTREPVFLGHCRASGLWGRRTAVFAGLRAKYTPGQGVTPITFTATASPREIDLALKPTWLPEKLLYHEHRVLTHIERAGVENVPRSRGCVALPRGGSGWRTMTHRRAGDQRERQSQEASAPHLRLVALALEVPTGVQVPYEDLSVKMHVQLLRQLCAVLLDLARRALPRSQPREYPAAS